MKIVGLTGGIASGKSTVAALLEGLGIPVIDADRLGREAMSPGQPAFEEVAARWPKAVRKDGTLDRALLGETVFSDSAQRRELTDLVLPRILEAFESRARVLRASGEPCCVLEAATLLEEGLERMVDGVLLVCASPEAQIARLTARTGLSPERARRRLAAQLPLEAKRGRARWILENDGPQEVLPSRVRELWGRITADLGLSSRLSEGGEGERT
jgi:dephospho-CoA kinase